MIINEKDTLYFEKNIGVNAATCKQNIDY